MQLKLQLKPDVMHLSKKDLSLDLETSVHWLFFSHNDGKIIGKPWENHRKVEGVPSGNDYQVVPHKAVAEVSKIASCRRLVAVNHGSQSKATDGSKRGWRQRSVVVAVVVLVVAM